MFFRVVISLFVLPFASEAAVRESGFGRAFVSQAREPMAVFIEYDGIDHFTRLESVFFFESFLVLMTVPVFGQRDVVDASLRSRRAASDTPHDADTLSVQAVLPSA